MNYNVVALTDHSSISGAVSFVKVCKNVCKHCGEQKSKHKDDKCKNNQEFENANLLPILGIEANIAIESAKIHSKENHHLHQIVLARNLTGWKKLIKLVSISNDEENFYYRPRIDLDILSDICDDNLISFSGHPGSYLYDLVVKGDEKDIDNYIGKMKDIFKNNFFVEIQFVDNRPETLPIMQELRNLAEFYKLTPIATCDAHYATQDQIEDHRVLLCSSLQTTLKEVHRKIENEEKVGLDGFFRSNRFHIPSPEEMLSYGHTKEEIENTLIIAEGCERYDILFSPKLPKFEWTEGMSEIEYLKHLCRQGWKRLGLNNKENKQEYIDRVLMELKTIQESKLEGYFLIVQNYVNYAKSQNWLISPGRGCLHSNTNIICKNGQIKKICDIKIEDIIYTNNGTEQSIKQVYKYDCNETLIKIETYYGDYEPLIVTQDHKLLIEKHKVHKWSKTIQNSRKFYIEPTGKLEWIQASKVKIGDWLVLPKIQRNNTTENIIIDLAQYCITDDLRYDDKYIYFEPKNKLCHIIMFSKKVNRYIKLDYDILFIIGLFCGDGWLCHKNQLGFAFNTKEIDNLKFVQNKFEQLGCETSYRKHKTKELLQLYINHKVFNLFFADLFCDYKRNSQTKHVPKIIFNLSNEHIRHFLLGYLASDGYIDKTKIKFSTTSQKLAHEIRFLLLCIGLPSSIKISDRIGQKNITHLEYIINCPLSSILNTKNGKKCVYRDFDKYILIKIRNIYNIQNEYKQVYDIKVDQNHNYLTTNGIVHNSVGGCLISHLLNITTIDPIKYNLIFERFFNKGRSTTERISLPDIDTDFPVSKRELIIQYIKDKYGHNKVAQIATFGKLMGRGALKEVLRIHNVCDFNTMNIITKEIPQEFEIADKLEEAGEESILMYILKYEPKLISNYCKLENDKLIGEYAQYFEQASRLERVIKSQGKHAAGIVVSQEPLDLICPMIRDKQGEKIIGFDMYDCEDVGLVKFDILGVLMLDRLMGINNLLQFGEIR